VPIKNDRTNWLYLFIGMLMVGLFFMPPTRDIAENELTTRTVVVSENIKNINYWKNENKYRLSTREHKCQFLISTPGYVADSDNQLDSIRKNDTLIIQFATNELTDLDKPTENVEVYSLKKSEYIYDLEGYNFASKTLNRRWASLLLFIGGLFLLRGFALISSKTASIVTAIGIAIIVSARLLNFW